MRKTGREGRKGEREEFRWANSRKQGREKDDRYGTEIRKYKSEESDAQ